MISTVLSRRGLLPIPDSLISFSLFPSVVPPPVFPSKSSSRKGIIKAALGLFAPSTGSLAAGPLERGEIRDGNKGT